MKKQILISLFLIMSCLLIAQNDKSVRYFKSRSQNKEVNKDEAKYIEKTTYRADLKIVTLTKVKNQQLIWKKEFRKEDNEWLHLKTYDTNGNLEFCNVLTGYRNPDNYLAYDYKNNKIDTQLNSPKDFIPPKFEKENNMSFESALKKWVGTIISIILLKLNWKGFKGWYLCNLQLVQTVRLTMLGF